MGGLENLRPSKYSVVSRGIGSKAADTTRTEYLWGGGAAPTPPLREAYEKKLDSDTAEMYYLSGLSILSYSAVLAPLRPRRQHLGAALAPEHIAACAGQEDADQRIQRHGVQHWNALGGRAP